MTHPVTAFWAMGVVPRAVVAAFAAIVALGAWMLWLDPASAAPGALMMVVLVQMFAAATGFWGPAGRGHYDPVLTMSPRVGVAVGHWIVSIAPGIAAWLAVAAIEAALARTWPMALGGPALTALVLVSCVSWALTVPCPRATAGVAWVVAIAALLTTRVGFDLLTIARGATASSPPWVMGQTVVVAIVCPFVWFAERPLPPVVALANVVTAAVALAAGVWAVVRRDYALGPGS